MLSKNYKHWVSIPDAKRCEPCDKLHVKIYGIYEKTIPKPPLHFFCRCKIKIMDAIKAGEATDKKTDGADFWLKYMKKLPDYYITEDETIALGFLSEFGNLGEVAPNMMLTKGVYKNKNGHLPDVPGRIWYEADINYKYGYRNSDRILFSNDGLIFVTYDHYKTFIEIV